MSIFGAFGNFARSSGGKAAGMAGKAPGWFGGLSPTAKSSLIGAATGGMTGAFGMNPMNPMPVVGDVDAGGFFGGALAGAGAGALYGKFGAGRNLMRKPVLAANRGLRGLSARSGGNMVGRGADFARGALLKTNKYGDVVAAGMAAGAAGLIGGSVLSTNSSY